MNFNEVKLYNKNSKNDIKIWYGYIKIKKNNKYLNNIDLVDSIAEIHTFAGLLDGKHTQHIEEILTGKNIGKSNETNVYTQAFNILNSKINKKIKEGYTYDLNKTTTKLFPMLAKDFMKEKDKDIIQYPVYVQPKLDGVRAWIKYEKNEIKILSRELNEYTTLEHIKDELRETSILNKNIILDGEVYLHNNNFQTLISLVKNQNITENTLKLKFYVYDIILLDDLEMSFEDRYNILSDIFDNTNFLCIKLLKTFKAKNETDVYKYHNVFLDKNYEGTIVRNINGKYDFGPKRSNNLFKLKSFDDAEYKIIDYEEGKGTNKGLIIFICENNDKVRFNVVPNWDADRRKLAYSNGDFYINKKITVKYFGLSKNNIPRFPRGIEIRDYE
jgi:DNA ligase-1